MISKDSPDFVLTDVCVHSNILSREGCTETDDDPLDIHRNWFALWHGICGGEGLGTSCVQLLINLCKCGRKTNRFKIISETHT